MLKRLIIVACSVVICLCLCGCGGKSGSSVARVLVEIRRVAAETIGGVERNSLPLCVSR